MRKIKKKVQKMVEEWPCECGCGNVVTADEAAARVAWGMFSESSREGAIDDRDLADFFNEFKIREKFNVMIIPEGNRLKFRFAHAIVPKIEEFWNKEKYQFMLCPCCR